jgi:hypothetical protein
MLPIFTWLVSGLAWIRRQVYLAPKPQHSSNDYGPFLVYKEIYITKSKQSLQTSSPIEN